MWTVFSGILGHFGLVSVENHSELVGFQSVNGRGKKKSLMNRAVKLIRRFDFYVCVCVCVCKLFLMSHAVTLRYWRKAIPLSTQQEDEQKALLYIKKKSQGLN